MDTYFKKKEQLSVTTPKSHIDVVDTKRASTPTVVSTTNVVGKKIAYKSDVEAKHADLKSQLDNHKSELDAKHADLKKQVDALKASVDTSKVDAVKSTLNDSITKTNESLSHVGNALVEHLNEINVLKSKVSNIESCM